MGTLDNTAAASFLKEKFNSARMRNLSYPAKAPLIGMMRKNTNYGGTDRKTPIGYADIAGVSADFAVAQANKRASKTKHFEVVTVEDYALFSVAGKTVRESKGTAVAVAEEMAEAMTERLARSEGMLAVIEGAAAVAGRDVEIAVVRPEGDVAGVVVRVGL